MDVIETEVEGRRNIVLGLSFILNVSEASQMCLSHGITRDVEMQECCRWERKREVTVGWEERD